MKIGVTGTPGTGKSTVSKHLKGKIVDLREYLEEQSLGEFNENGEIEVDLDELRENPPVEPENKDLVIEGHMAQFLDLDYCIVLRTSPEVLEKRLNKREYSRQKIQENLDAEKLDVVLSQSVENQEEIFEIDTTDKNVKETAERIREALQSREERLGVVDWSGYI